MDKYKNILSYRCPNCNKVHSIYDGENPYINIIPYKKFKCKSCGQDLCWQRDIYYVVMKSSLILVLFSVFLSIILLRFYDEFNYIISFVWVLGALSTIALLIGMIKSDIDICRDK